MHRNPKLFPQSLALVALIAAVANPSLSQTTPNKKTQPTQSVLSIGKPRPDPAVFDTYEGWIEALANWVVEQRLTTADKQVILNAGSGAGRFQIVFSPNARADTFMIDTQTGKVWQFVTYVDLEGDPHVWQSVPRLDSAQDLGVWFTTQSPKKSSK